MKEKPSKWLIALFVGLGTVIGTLFNIPFYISGIKIKLGVIPIYIGAYIGAYFAAKGVQHLRRKKKINKKFPGNLSYNRNSLDPNIRKQFELVRGDKYALKEYATLYAKDPLISPYWIDDIIEDYMQPLSK